MAEKNLSRLLRAMFSGGIALGLGALAAPAEADQAVSSAASDAPKEIHRPGDQIQQVIVTATKRRENVNQIPISVTAITGEELEAQHITDFASAAAAIPNLSFSGGGGNGNAGNGPGLSNIELRGISTSGGAGTVGIYLDDVSITMGNYYSLGNPEPKFFDLDRIEVLRGPQGTLYGASSMGGTVKFVSNQPDLKHQEINVSTDVSHTEGGGYNNTVTGVFNKVLIPNELALRIGVQTGHKSGYIDQLNPAATSVVASDINWETDQVARIAMKWNPIKDLSITPVIFYQQVASGDINVSYLSTQTGAALANNQTTKLIREPGTDTLFVPSLTINYGMGIGELTSVTSYYKRTFNRTQDGTSINSPYLGSKVLNDPALAAIVGALPSAVYLNNKANQFSQEIRLSSEPYDQKRSPITWVAGAYLSNVNTNIIDNEPVFGINAAFAAAGLSPANPNDLAGAVSVGFPNDNSYFAHRAYHDQQHALFGEASYYFKPEFHATLGLRYLRATQTFVRSSAFYYDNDGTNDGFAYSSVDSSGSKLTPKIALTWNVNDANTIYATAQEGFRTGGSNFPIPEAYCDLSGPNPLNFAPDTLWSYEIGNKSRFLNNALSVNAAAFYIDWKNIQQQIPLGCGFNYNVNVGAATSYGAELEVKYIPAPGVRIDMAGGYTHATLQGNSGINAGIKGAVDGANLPGVPKFNLALSGMYNFNFTEDIPGFIRGAARWTGVSNGALDPLSQDYQRPAYATVDLSAGASFKYWDMTLYITNAGNNQKVVQRPIVQSTTNLAYRIPPRTIGVTFSGKL